MSTRSPAVRSSDIQFNGQALVLHSSGDLALDAASTLNAGFYFPYGGELQEVNIVVQEACGTAAATFEVGTLADQDYFATQSIATTDALGTTFKATLLQTLIVPGTTVYFATDGGATTTGIAVGTIVVGASTP